MTDVVDGFIELFQGNNAAVGTEEGGCYRLKMDMQASLQSLVRGHLTGANAPIGVYPMVPFPTFDPHEVQTEGLLPTITAEWRVHWGCVDFDEGDEVSLVHARNVQAVLNEFGVSAWIERSRSKGFHLWVFADDWVPAVVMRKALLGACQVVDAPTKEINPKQVALKEGQLGNYVRLPYPDSMRPGYLAVGVPRRVVIHTTGANDWAMSLEMFVEQALESRVSEETLVMVGDTLYVDKPKPQRRATRPPSAPMLGDPQMRLGGLAFTIWKDGPLDGAGRGHTLYRLACLIYEDGQHTAEEAEELLLDADERWGKFNDRGEPEYISKMVDKIWEDE